jgi:6,7-dimethyl-8-ribityllumazine synthase
MAGKSPKLKTLNASKLKVAVVSASWHPEICSSLIDGAKRALAANKVNKVSYHEVSGSFELPLAAQKLFDSGTDVVVVLGLILKGDTPHFDYICEGVTNGIMQVSLSRSKPIGFGVLMCNTLKQARDRAGFVDSKEDKGFDAAIAAINSALNY